MRLLIQLIVLIVPSVLLAASFDCVKSHTEVERIICSDTQLSDLDDQLSNAYHRVLDQAENKAETKGEQTQWLKDVRDKCSTAYSLVNAYRKRLRDLQLDCSVPKNQFEKLACSASDTSQLEDTFQTILNEWTPHLTKRAYYPITQSQALIRWYRETELLFGNWTKGCITLACKRARIAQAMELWSFPREPYDALLAWIKKEGGQSSLLTSNLWKLSSADAVAAWTVFRGKIYRLGENPAWLSLTDAFSAPNVAPPFLGRNLTYAEARNLEKMVTVGSSMDVTVSGVTDGMRRSVHFFHGGSGQCSPNQLISSVDVSNQFPLPRDMFVGRSNRFKIIEIKKAPIKQSIPSCALDDPNPEGFFPSGQESYWSRVVIDDVRGLFVRPDGTFWMKLSDDNWYRFRRDMTSGALEIGSKYNVISCDEFDTILEKCKNVNQLDTELATYIGNRKPK